MPAVVIDNPILNSPFAEPSRHFRFSEDGITDQIVDGRRESGHFLPTASPRKKRQLKFDTEWTQDRFQSSPRINRIRDRVTVWRHGGYIGCTRTTERLLQYWTDPTRERKLFFCQVEALETAIYLTEVASHYGDSWIENELCDENAGFNSGLPRLAFKMATGSGKTVVMAMIVEVSGEARKDKAAKVAAARTLWVPAVNNHGGFGRWGFVEVTDPWDAKGVIRAALDDVTITMRARA